MTDRINFKMTDLENRVKNLEEIMSEQNKKISIGFDKIGKSINKFKKKLEISNPPVVHLPTTLEISDKTQDTMNQLESRHQVNENENTVLQNVNNLITDFENLLLKF